MIENVTPREAWEALLANPQAHLIDVRSEAEWTFVGLPDLTDAGKQPLLVAWQSFPAMRLNEGFVDTLRQTGIAPNHKLYFLCRSGARSAAAASAMQAAGYQQSFNIADGFEGPTDESGHRGSVAGWKAEGLPWQQR